MLFDSPWSHVDRDIIAQSPQCGPDIEVAVVYGEIGRSKALSFREEHHSVFVHLGGELTEVEAEFEKGPSARLQPSIGGVWMVPADCGYSAMLTGESTKFCEIRLPKVIRNCTSLELSPLIDAGDALLHQAALRFQRLASAKDDMSKMAATHLTEAMRWHVIQRYGKDTARNNKRTMRATLPSRVKAMLECYIKDNLSEKIILDDLSELANLTTHNLLKQFSASFGHTPAQYIINKRIERAKNLLQMSTLQVTDIALATGFYSSSHFSSSFTKQVGLPPLAYRHRCAE